MQALAAFFAETGRTDIHALAGYIQQHVDAEWQRLFEAMHGEMVAKYDQLGEGVYGLYGARLFKPIHQQLKAIGWRATPHLPGNLNISREWGDSEADRQRWLWSKVTREDGSAAGTIATVFHHDHTAIRIPRGMEIIGLEAVSKREVVAALSAHAAEFGTALEAREEYAQYLEYLAAQGEGKDR